jgi:predicted Zn-dependent peptidase
MTTARQAVRIACTAAVLAFAPLRGVAQPDATIRLEAPSWAAHLEAISRPAAPMVGLAVALPRGSGADPVDRPGLGRLAAEAVVAEVEARMGAGEVEGRASVAPDRTVISFLVRPDQAAAVLATLGDVGFGAGPATGTVAAIRERRADVLRFELDSPLREVGVERRALLYGSGDPRTRPPGGTLAVVESAQDAEIDAARRSLFRDGQARIVAVGPVEVAGAIPLAARTPAVPPAAAADSSSAAADPSNSAPAAVPAGVASPAPPGGTTSTGPAWTMPDRRVVVREVTNTWISVAFPVPADLPRVAVLFVADRMQQELDATPPDPGLFNVSVRVAEMPEGEVLVVDAAVLPDASDRFERRILDLPARLAAERDRAFFRYHRGRFRAGRLIADAAPEQAAERMAAELLTRGGILAFDEAVWSLDVTTAADAAAALGPPRILIFGPDLDGDGP